MYKLKMFKTGLGLVRRSSAVGGSYRITRCQSTGTVEPAINPNRLDLRVGLIKSIERHENADSLYVSQIQIGPDAENTVQVCSGLVGLVPMDRLENSRVVIVNNLKPSKMRGVKSEAMLLCADGKTQAGETKVDPVSPPTEAPLGGLLEFTGIEEEVPDKKRIKSKVFEEISQELTVSGDNKWNVVWRHTHVLCYDKIHCCAVGLGDADFVGARVR